MIDEVLSRLGAGGYSPTYEQPEDIVKRIVSFQKGQRAGPITEQLQGVGQGYAQAAPEAQAQKRARANALRAAYIANGGRVADLDRNLWGSDPNQGFQTGEGQFHMPEYNVEDNMTNAQKERRSAITGLFEGKPTYGRQVEESGLTGLYQGKETPAYQLIKSQLEQAKTGGASDLAEWMFKQDYINNQDSAEKGVANRQKGINAAYDYIDKLGKVRTVTIPGESKDTWHSSKEPDKYVEAGWSTDTKTQMKDIVGDLFANKIIGEGMSVQQLIPYVNNIWGKAGTAPYIIGALQAAEAQYGAGK